MFYIHRSYRSWTSIIVVVLIVDLLNPTFAFGGKKPKGFWSEHKSDHFIVYYHPTIPSQYIKDFTRKCERYYDLVAERLGFNRFDFWLFDDRAKIFIYRTQEEYIEYTGRSEWSVGSVHVKKRRINTFRFHEDFFNVVLPHELAHIVLREFIGLKVKAPLWFDEGVASCNEKNSYVKYLMFAKGLIGEGMYMKIQDLENLNAKKIVFPSIFYSTSASLIIFLMEEYKKGKFVELCKDLKEGKDFYEAMDEVYEIKDAEDLNEKFLTFLKNKNYKDIAERESFSVEW